MSTSAKEMQEKIHESETQEIIYQRDKVGDEKFNTALRWIKKRQEEDVRQTMDATSTLLIEPGSCILTPEQFAAYPNSPTANRYQKAFDLYSTAFYLLTNYKKRKVENIDDCEYLQSAFHGYARAEMLEGHLYFMFQPPNNTSELIDLYLKKRPDDILVAYFKVAITLHPHPTNYKTENQSDFELQAKMIVAAEKFIHKRLRSAIASETDKSMLKSLYYTLGSIYVTTKQTKRALYAFQKCLDLDKTNVSALYGVACQYMEHDPEKAIKLLSDFISKAPECDKQYPNAFYMLAFLYWTRCNNIQEALRYCHLAEEAEKKRLSFLYPVDIKQKDAIQMLKSMH